MPGEITFEDYTPPVIENRFTPTVTYLREQLEAGVEKVARIPVADEEQSKAYLRELRTAANSQGVTASQVQPSSADTSGDLLVKVRPRIVHKPHERKSTEDASAESTTAAA